MFKFWSTIGVASLLLIGCAEDGSNEELQGTNDEAQVVDESSTADAVNESEAVEYSVTEPVGAAQAKAVTSVPSAGLNPAHGQPGHDCAIAVGAPLDGSGAQPQITTAPTISQPAAQPSLTTGGAANGLNPAHGQPGHDCAVAVGAPLPSK